MDGLFIHDLVLRGTHGVYEDEWVEPQEFTLDIAAELDTSKAVATDRLEDTVCWTYLQSVAREVIEGPRMNLLERMADTIAARILAGEPRITSVAVTLKKTEASVTAVPGVTVTRSR